MVKKKSLKTFPTDVSVDNYGKIRILGPAMRPVPKPTDAELEVLRVIWEHGPSTVRQIHDILEQHKSRGYTTILKTLQIMTDKGLVVRDDSNRSHVYQTKLTELATQRQLIRDLMDRAFGGSAAKLMLQVLGMKAATPQELDELQGLLNRRRQQDDQ
jgi:BlaI family transcriptional regulator, penicillinase repressor